MCDVLCAMCDVPKAHIGLLGCRCVGIATLQNAAGFGNIGKCGLRKTTRADVSQELLFGWMIARMT
jgi:F0F1-type ATP synthase membrane subunit c/vacuolar-type H+-ATPase subunit K